MCRRVGMADDADSKSVGGNTVWVQVPPPAPARRKRHIACDDFFATPCGFKSHRRHQLVASVISLATIFLQNRRALILLLLASPENPAAQVFPGAPPPCRAAPHCAPFKKPSRLTGLFSYRSVIPPSPHKTLLHKLSRGPAALCSIQSARPFGRAFLVPPAQNHQIQKPLPLCLSTFLRQAPIFARRAGENFGIIHNYEPMFLYGMMIPVTSNSKRFVKGFSP